MASIKAIVAREPKFAALNWALEEITIGEPGDDEVLVEIVASGICHTDVILSSMPGNQAGIHYPKIMGHEGAGYARKIGKNVTSVAIGDPVLLSFYSCGECGECKDQHPAHCDSFALENYVGRNGHVTSKTNDGEQIYDRFFGQSSFARYSIVAKSSVVNAKDMVRNEEELKLFAPLGCGFQTGMGAIENIANAGPQSVVVVMGLGNVGLAALMTAKAIGCKGIIGIDRLPNRLALAKELGATHVIDTSTPGVNITKAVHGIFPTGATIAIDTTGAPFLIEDGLKTLRQRGKLVLVGVPPAEYALALNAFQHINAGRSVIGCIEGDCVPKLAIPKLIQWYREGRFPIDKLVTFFEADEFKAALAAMHEGTVVKAVLKWS